VIEVSFGFQTDNENLTMQVASCILKQEAVIELLIQKGVLTTDEINAKTKDYIKEIRTGFNRQSFD
jgi:hypothetical protein